VHLQNIVPWGRTLEEYKKMFNLTEADLKSKIIGCGDGPASFNCQINEIGGSVVSIDPIYRYTKEQIKNRIDEVANDILEQIIANKDNFVWKDIKDAKELYTIRMEAMNKFLKDYELGKEEKRYIFGQLPKLPFNDSSFDIALSSHFLLLYSEHLDLEFHKKAILEMLRVAKEIRIFPIVDLHNKRSIHLDAIINMLKNRGLKTEVIKVDYEFQKGANEMLRIIKN